MAIARRKHLRLEVTPYYHCITRCVRRAFLCGRDPLTGKNFSHRKRWVEQHLMRLSHAFSIDVAAFAVMSNHYHLVLHVDSAKANRLSDCEVIARWSTVYKMPILINRYINQELLSKEDEKTVSETIQYWREELTNISRFMAHLNENIARRANKEDNCKGRFWESRFKLQAILDEKALIRTLAYVDLNPVRAGIAKTPETSKFTSVRRRLTKVNSGLMKFSCAGTQAQSDDTSQESNIPITFKDYLVLLDYTGRILKSGKKAVIPSNAPPIIARLGYTQIQWMKTQSPRLAWLQRALGDVESIKSYCEAIGQRWIWQSEIYG